MSPARLTALVAFGAYQASGLVGAVAIVAARPLECALGALATGAVGVPLYLAFRALRRRMRAAGAIRRRLTWEVH